MVRRVACIASPRSARTRSAPSSSASPLASSSLTQMSEGLSRPRTENAPAKSRTHRAAQGQEPRHRPQHYHIDIDTDPIGECATAVRFTRQPVEGSMMTNSGRVLPAQQSDRLGRGDSVADLRHADRHRGGVPLAQIRTRPASHLPSQAHSRRRPSVHHRHRLPARPGDSPASSPTGETASGDTLRRILEGHQRITATFRRADGRTFTCERPPVPNRLSRPSTTP